MRRFLAALAFVAALPSAGQAQEYLDQPQLEAILQDNGFCYYLQPDGSCGWVEVFRELGMQGTRWHLATSFAPGDLSVVEQEGVWINGALCIRDDDFGIIGLTGGSPPFFFFDMRDQTPQGPEAIQDLIELLAPSVLPKTCFRYTPDPNVDGGYLQHVFADGVRQDSEDPIVLVPLSQGSVRIVTGQ
ncbi:hypothetical protein HKCCE4037_10885 [Rhodobacterales bacterium HKCCE4037]|nr:hypothetical protein [Rhodobacterales bacterium HKCCE4037]